MTLLVVGLTFAVLVLLLDRRSAPRHRIDSFEVPPPVPVEGDAPWTDFDD